MTISSGGSGRAGGTTVSEPSTQVADEPEMSPGDPVTPPRRRFQTDLRTLLAVTAIVALSTALPASPASLLLGLIAVPILAAAVCTWNRWPWWIGLVFLVVLAAALTPADPASMLIVATPACVVYMLTLLAWNVMRKRRTD